MSQVLSGLRLGQGISILFGSYDPNSPVPGGDSARAGIDWIFIRLGSGSPSTWLYRCDTGATFGPGGVLLTQAHWTAK